MSIATALNFSNTTPAAPTGKQLIVPQNDAGAPTCNESFYDPVMVGDSGSGGLAGNVPAPAAGDAAAGKFLKADGAWHVPPGAVAATLSAAPSAAGNFQIAHGLSGTPSRISILPTSAGSIWQQAPPDATYVYLSASDAGITATISVFA
jgi:hypothetical protein